MTIFSNSPLGMILGNAAITASVFLLQWLLAALLVKAAHCAGSTYFDTHDARGASYFPSVSIFVMAFFFQGTVLGAARLVLVPEFASSPAVGGLAALVCCTAALWVGRRVKEKVPMRAYYRMDPALRGRPVATFFVGPGEWVSRAPTNNWALRYATVIRTYKEKFVWFYLIEAAASATLSAIFANDANTLVQCGHIRSAAALVLLLLLVCHHITMPRARPRDTWFDRLSIALQCLAMTFKAIGYYSGEVDDGWHGTAQWVLRVSVGIFIAKTACDAVVEGVILISGRRDRLQAETYLEENGGRGGKAVLLCPVPSSGCGQEAPAPLSRSSSGTEDDRMLNATAREDHAVSLLFGTMHSALDPNQATTNSLSPTGNADGFNNTQATHHGQQSFVPLLSTLSVWKPPIDPRAGLGDSSMRTKSWHGLSRPSDLFRTLKSRSGSVTTRDTPHLFEPAMHPACDASSSDDDCLSPTLSGLPCSQLYTRVAKAQGAVQPLLRSNSMRQPTITSQLVGAAGNEHPFVVESPGFDDTLRYAESQFGDTRRSHAMSGSDRLRPQVSNTSGPARSPTGVSPLSGSGRSPRWQSRSIASPMSVAPPVDEDRPFSNASLDSSRSDVIPRFNTGTAARPLAKAPRTVLPSQMPFRSAKSLPSNTAVEHVAAPSTPPGILAKRRPSALVVETDFDALLTKRSSEFGFLSPTNTNGVATSRLSPTASLSSIPSVASPNTRQTPTNTAKHPKRRNPSRSISMIKPPTPMASSPRRSPHDRAGV
ncbi:hypothetical protein DIPPA_34254 [Diplonema papillatum]|nr:hypothetical protein DIPPA_34254 [Diplonema papillatum]